jgi:phage terminase large subunit-like protein
VVSRATKRIVDRRSRSFLRAVSADAHTQHGLNPACVVLDEIAQQPNRDLFDVLATSMGARRSPLLLAIGTAGHDQHSIAFELYRHGKRCLESPGTDASFFSCIKELPEALDWADEQNWIYANPGLGDFRDLDELRDMRDRALLLPSLAGAFKNLYCNQWTEAEHAWLDLAAWDRCSGTVTDAELEGLPCWGGLDLSSTTDLTSLAIVFRQPDDRYAVRHWAWIPAEGIVERERRDGVPYREWATAGIIEPLPGAVIDSRIVARRVVEECTRWKVRGLAFDRWGSKVVTPILMDAGLTIFSHGQGYRDMSPATKQMQELVLAGRLLHGGCPLLRWQASSVTVATDPAGNIKPTKPGPLAYARRIDSIVATVMALSPAMADQPRDDSQIFAEFTAV